jgi:hypothetical protein
VVAKPKTRERPQVAPARHRTGSRCGWTSYPRPEHEPGQQFLVTWIDEETVIEPNGRELLVGAAFVAEFDGDAISAFRNYFDNAALLEQMVVR